MIFNLIDLKNIKIRIAKQNEIKDIRRIFQEAFEPYRKYYTKQAFSHAILLSEQEFKDRLNDPNKTILVAIYENIIIGTISLIFKDKHVYLQNMAVKPSFQGFGIGRFLMEEVERIVKEKDFCIIVLECFKPLKRAQVLYKKSGFKMTGKKKPFNGVIFFEMKKKLI